MTTFDPDRICWFDFETKSEQDLQDAGAVRYACDESTKALILTYAIGREPPKLCVGFGTDPALSWFSLPEEFIRFHDRAEGDPSYKFAAFNAGFDRAILNYTVPGTPRFTPDMIIDPSVQATAAGLPSSPRPAAARSWPR
jgi:hypothetical protein